MNRWVALAIGAALGLALGLATPTPAPGERRGFCHPVIRCPLP